MLERPGEQRASTLVSAAFMVLVGLSMPAIFEGPDAEHPAPTPASLHAAAPGSARAADLYLQGHLSVSAGVGDTGGAVQFNPAPPIPFTGDDTDSSPLFSGAFGYEFPLNEMFPLA